MSGRLERLAVWLLGIAAALLLAAPLFMPASYSWVANTTSESAAQGVDNAWVARAGFAAMAVGVAAVVITSRSRWNPLTMLAHGVFALCMCGAAAFSARPWFAGAFDATEDLLHSVFASTMGFAFAGGIVSSLFDDRGHRRPIRVVDVAALLASIGIPLIMFNVDGVAGVAQRVMFAVAFWWYLACLLRRGSASHATPITPPTAEVTRRDPI